jgi:hypothetical protein
MVLPGEVDVGRGEQQREAEQGQRQSREPRERARAAVDPGVQPPASAGLGLYASTPASTRLT